MRTRVAAVCLLACIIVSSCRPTSQAGPAAVAPPPASASTPSNPPAATTASGTEHVVLMLGDAQGYRFEPANLTIRSGDKVRFKMVSGGPHNITFDTVSIPAAAKARLEEITSSALGKFNGPMLLYPDEAYIVTFVGIPPGTYAFHCMPHQVMNQRGSITVR